MIKVSSVQFSSVLLLVLLNTACQPGNLHYGPPGGPSIDPPTSNPTGESNPRNDEERGRGITEPENSRPEERRGNITAPENNRAEKRPLSSSDRLVLRLLNIKEDHAPTEAERNKLKVTKLLKMPYIEDIETSARGSNDSWALYSGLEKYFNDGDSHHRIGTGAELFEIFKTVNLNNDAIADYLLAKIEYYKQLIRD